MYYYIPPHPMTTLSINVKTNKQILVHDYKDVQARVTAYTVSYGDCGKIDGITASGKRIKSGMIAAPSNIPFGSIITIDGKDLVVEDRGGAIVIQRDGTYNIDYYVPTTKQANDYGVQYKIIRVHGLKSTEFESIKEDKQWTITSISHQKNMQNSRDLTSVQTIQQSVVSQSRSQQSSKLWQLLLSKTKCTLMSYLLWVYLRMKH